MMEDKEMQILKDRIRKDGKIREGNVLKVDSFLHNLYVSLRDGSFLFFLFFTGYGLRMFQPNANKI